MRVSAVIVAAGRGTRAGGDVPKQWRSLAGQSVAERCLQVFDTHPTIDRIVLVLHPEDIAANSWPGSPAVDIVAGGTTRRDSVLAGLQVLEGTSDLVLIHDVARPLVSHALISRVIDALSGNTAAAPALPVTDALWRGADGKVSGTQSRDALYRAQTPQGFHLPAILAAHRAHTGQAADDVEVAKAAGLDVAIIPGEERNMKITGPEDFARAEALLGQDMDIRVGNGFDVHRFGPGDAVTLCGVTVPFDKTLQGHSDADVGMHALTDAIYGALAKGDIGQHFPPSDPQWKGAASHIFLDHAINLAIDMGYKLSNADVTLICEQPKIGPHAAAMSAKLAKILNCETDRVSVKATTTERLGFAGRGEGIAAQASATLVKI